MKKQVKEKKFVVRFGSKGDPQKLERIVTIEITDDHVREIDVKYKLNRKPIRRHYGRSLWNKYGTSEEREAF